MRHANTPLSERALLHAISKCAKCSCSVVGAFRLFVMVVLERRDDRRSRIAAIAGGRNRNPGSLWLSQCSRSNIFQNRFLPLDGRFQPTSEFGEINLNVTACCSLPQHRLGIRRTIKRSMENLSRVFLRHMRPDAGVRYSAINSSTLFIGGSSGRFPSNDGNVTLRSKNPKTQDPTGTRDHKSAACSNGVIALSHVA